MICDRGLTNVTALSAATYQTRHIPSVLGNSSLLILMITLQDSLPCFTGEETRLREVRRLGIAL